MGVNNYKSLRYHYKFNPQQWTPELSDQFFKHALYGRLSQQEKTKIERSQKNQQHIYHPCDMDSNIPEMTSIAEDSESYESQMQSFMSDTEPHLKYDYAQYEPNQSIRIKYQCKFPENTDTYYPYHFSGLNFPRTLKGKRKPSLHLITLEPKHNPSLNPFIAKAYECIQQHQALIDVHNSFKEEEYDLMLTCYQSHVGN
ncbi:MAG: hypothetical protein AAF901_14035, partial [Bacteroidota bacterium]